VQALMALSPLDAYGRRLSSIRPPPRKIPGYAYAYI